MTNMERMKAMGASELAHLMDTIHEELFKKGKFCSQYCRYGLKDGCKRLDDMGNVDCIYDKADALEVWLNSEVVEE